MKTAVVTGVSGQDGRYATRLLVDAGYRVVGTSRNPEQAKKALANWAAVEIVEWDLRDQDTFNRVLTHFKPTEIYNFSAYSTGSGMYDDPIGIGEVNGLSAVIILEGIRAIDPAIRFCQASSSEMFGEPRLMPQDENTSFYPRSPYGAAKLFAHSMIGIYRRRYGLFACSAILFNHESPYRSEAFVTRKITRAAASIKLGFANHFSLGSLEARRDWGYAGDYVRAMWLMLQTEFADDFVVATGRTHSVAELCEIAFSRLGLDYRDYVRLDQAAVRAPEALQLVGDASKAARELGWTREISFAALINMMVDADLDRLRRSGRAE